MKKILGLVCCGAASLALSLNAQAASTTGTAKADVQEPAAITVTASDTPMYFGLIVPSTSSSGTLVMSNAGTLTATTVTSTGTATTGTFTVTGSDNTVTINLPTTITLNDGTSTNQMTISDVKFKFGDDGDVAATGSAIRTTDTIEADGTKLSVFGTLTVGQSQAGGSYSGTYTVAVVY